jgi:hypothetical protein
MARKQNHPELEELIESIENAPPPPRRPIRLPRRPLIALAGIGTLLLVLAVAAPEAFLDIVTDPFRAVSLAAETIGNALSILVR